MDKQSLTGIELPKMTAETDEATAVKIPAEKSEEVEMPKVAENKTEEKESASIATSQNEGIELPDIVVPEEEKHIPTLEELEAQRKAEEKAEKAIKKENHERTFTRNEEVLYTEKEEKEGNPIVLLVIFAVIVSFVFLLPVINTNLRKIFGLDYSYFENKWSATPTAPQIQQETQKHSFKDSSTRVEIGNLALTNFVTTKNDEKYEIDFTIINEGDESYIYDKKYYIVLYNDDNLIYRALIHSYKPLASKAADELSLPITEFAYKRANGFELVEISETQYPEVEFVGQSDNYDLLTCTYNNDTMEYYFEDNMLIKVKEKYFEEKMESYTYQEDYEDYKGYSYKYNQINGFESTFVETSEDFTMIATGNLNQIQDITMSDLKVYKFFKYRTNSRVVAFEMSALGYTCDNK